MDSDVDLIVLTVDKDAYLTNVAWIGEAAGDQARSLRTGEWGPLTELRVVLPSGLEIEYGFAPTRWAGVAPLDTGTASVVTGGLRILHDPDGLLAALLRAVND
jgi:hypothetical protein